MMKNTINNKSANGNSTFNFSYFLECISVFELIDCKSNFAATRFQKRDFFSIKSTYCRSFWIRVKFLLRKLYRIYWRFYGEILKELSLSNVLGKCIFRCNCCFRSNKSIEFHEYDLKQRHITFALSNFNNYQFLK